MTLRTTKGAALAAACVLGVGCISTPVSSASDPVGCWYFDRDAAATALNLPWGIRLAGDALSGFAGLEQRGEPRIARTLDPDAEQDHPFGYWLPIAGDSIEIGYPAGGGMVLRVAGGDTSLSGTARAVGDVVAPGAPPRQTHAIRLTRAQCPSY